MKNPPPAFGPVLRRIRTEKGLTQEDLSEKLGYNSSGYVSRLELGEKKPSVDLLFLIADALETTPSAILAEMEKMR